MSGYKITRQTVNELERQRNHLDRRLNECGVENTDLRLAFEETLRDRSRYFNEMNEVRQKFYDMIGERDEYRDRLEKALKALSSAYLVVNAALEWHRVRGEEVTSKKVEEVIKAISDLDAEIERYEETNV